MNITWVQTHRNMSQTQAVQLRRSITFLQELNTKIKSSKPHVCSLGRVKGILWNIPFIGRALKVSYWLENLEAVHILCIYNTYSNCYICRGG